MIIPELFLLMYGQYKLYVKILSFHVIVRNSRSQMFFKISVQACNFIKKRFQHSCSPVKFAKFLRTALFEEHLRWLLLYC